MTTSPLDPITQVFNATWDLLKAYEPLAAIVPAGNMIQLNTDVRNPDKETMLAADFPQIRLVPISSEPHLQRTSNGSSLNIMFGIQIATGEKRPVAELFPVEWNIYCAVLSWPEYIRENIGYVKLARPRAVTNQMGTPGWMSVMILEVQMWFDTEDMKNADI